MSNLIEDLVMLMISDDKSRLAFESNPFLRLGIAGGAIVQLVESQRLQIQGETLLSTSKGKAGDYILDDVVKKVENEFKDRRVYDLVGYHASKRFNYLEITLDRLLKKQVLSLESQRILLIFGQKQLRRHPISTDHSKREQTFRNWILNRGQLDREQLLLASLVDSCLLIDEIFTGKESKLATKNLQHLFRQKPISKPVEVVFTGLRHAATDLARTVGLSELRGRGLLGTLLTRLMRK